ncbi:MAG: NAD(+)/NADH kinase [Candidatus Eisenbacteria bacterium]|nr:NAD(+)/NADH kinase [Candidatus Eisenbacteria bacterium]
MKHVSIVANVRKENSGRVAAEIAEWLERRGVAVSFENEIAALEGRTGFALAELPPDCDLVVALGGDGTLLWVARHACLRGVPILGVNLGGLGFLTELSVAEVIPTLERMQKGDCRVEERMMLEAVVEGHSGSGNSRYVCLNDAVINKSAFARAMQLDMSISGHYVGTFLADGLIVSTPTGSTAYSLSAGGPIVKPTIEALIATPICPHTLAVRPLIFSGDEELSVEVVSGKTDVALTIDGQECRELAHDERIVFRRAPEKTSLVCCGEKSFYEVLRTKLCWGGLAKR